MEFKEILEIVDILIKTSVDNYHACKIMILSNIKSPEAKYFSEELFKETDKCRPKLLEMKGGTE